MLFRKIHTGIAKSYTMNLTVLIVFHKFLLPQPKNRSRVYGMGVYWRSQEFVLEATRETRKAEIRGLRPRPGEELLDRGQRAPSSPARRSGGAL